MGGKDKRFGVLVGWLLMLSSVVSVLVQELLFDVVCFFEGCDNVEWVVVVKVFFEDVGFVVEFQLFELEVCG